MLLQSALGLQSDRCRELWRVYDLAQVDLRPLLERNQGLEQQLDALLVMHDISSDGSYHSILMAGTPLPPLPRTPCGSHMTRAKQSDG